jgi:hypothetical protein
MKRASFLSLVLTVLLSLCATLCAQNNAQPLLYQPLIPTATAPGSAGFTLTVNGYGFVSGAVLNWNGSARATTVVSSSQVQATITSADVAHVGTANITVGNPAPGGGVSNVVYFPVRAPALGVAFAPEPGVAPSSGPVAVGDFTGHGILDIAVAENTATSTTILLYRGLGNGTFAAPISSSVTLPIYSLFTGDFNNDGKLDLVSSTSIGDFNVNGMVLLNDGSGHFVQQTPFAGGDDGWVVGVADVNGDGNLDVLFEGEAQGNGAVQVCLGNGDGTFTLKYQASENNYDGSPIGIGDFNGDGKLDMAVTDDYQIDIFLGNGDGTFQPFVPYACPLGYCYGSITVADLNGDGKLDLIVGELNVFMGNGDGTFTPGFNFSPNGEGVNVVGDFNGDGKLDIAVIGPTVSVYLGNGDGTFQNPISSGSFTSGASAGAFGDFNRDGQLDIVNFASPADQIGLQTSLGVTPGSLNFGSIKIGATSKGQALTLTNVSSKAVPISSIALTGANAGDYVEHNTCGAGLHAGATCQITLAFKPTVKGTLPATVSITYSGVASPQTVPLTGYGF